MSGLLLWLVSYWCAWQVFVALCLFCCGAENISLRAIVHYEPAFHQSFVTGDSTGKEDFHYHYEKIVHTSIHQSPYHQSPLHQPPHHQSPHRRSPHRQSPRLGHPPRVDKRSSGSSHLRILTVYDEASLGLLSMRKQRLVQQTVMPQAEAYWERTLRVKRSHSPVKLSRHCLTERVRYAEGDPYFYCVDGCAAATMCGNVAVPPEHLHACRLGRIGEDLRDDESTVSGEGAGDADFILYVSMVQSGRCKVTSTLAYAAYCQLEAVLDRPVAGYVNLCPLAISTLEQDVQQMVYTVRHEILHALGFSAALYAFYRDDHGEPLTQRDAATGKPPFSDKLNIYQWSPNVVRQVTRDNWLVSSGRIVRHFLMMVTPRVVQEVRHHFACPTLEGGELEDQGGVGTTITHWEKRVFENEAMTGTYTQNPVISRVTLALLEDTGWYSADYSLAGDFLWGRGLGCAFVQRSCAEWMATHRPSPKPFCLQRRSSDQRLQCTLSRDAQALCNLKEHPAPLPAGYRHFTALPNVSDRLLPRFGGSVALADFCPYIQEFYWRKASAVVRSSNCLHRQNNVGNDENYLLEEYGDFSGCFDHEGLWKVRYCSFEQNVVHWGSGCYRYLCSPESGLSIVVNNSSLQCYREGQVLLVQTASSEWLHSGRILCPSCRRICEKSGEMKCPLDSQPPAEDLNLLHPARVPCLSGASAFRCSAIPCLLALLFTSFVVPARYLNFRVGNFREDFSINCFLENLR